MLALEEIQHELLAVGDVRASGALLAGLGPEPFRGVVLREPLFPLVLPPHVDHQVDRVLADELA
jgi:hypothetical protein